MQVRFEILKKDDTVLNVWDNKIAIKKNNGDVEILSYEWSENTIPRISSNSILITRGNGIVRAKDENSSLEVGTF